MSLVPSPFRTAQEPNEAIARADATHRGTRLIALAAVIDLARSNPSNTDFRTFCAPDRPIAIPDGRWRTCKNLSRGSNLCISLAWRKEVRRNDGNRDLGEKAHRRQLKLGRSGWEVPERLLLAHRLPIHSAPLGKGIQTWPHYWLRAQACNAITGVQICKASPSARAGWLP